MFWNRRGPFGPPGGPMPGRFGHRGGPFVRPGGGPGRGFGMRRPLRFLIERLGLDPAQANEVQRAFEDLRLEREQADLDRRKGQARLADLLEADAPDAAALEAAAEVRVAAAKREKDAIVAAFRRIHAALRPEQRPVVAALLREGPLSL